MSEGERAATHANPTPTHAARKGQTWRRKKRRGKRSREEEGDKGEKKEDVVKRKDREV